MAKLFARCNRFCSLNLSLFRICSMVCEVYGIDWSLRSNDWEISPSRLSFWRSLYASTRLEKVRIRVIFNSFKFVLRRTDGYENILIIRRSPIISIIRMRHTIYRCPTYKQIWSAVVEWFSLLKTLLLFNWCEIWEIFHFLQFLLSSCIVSYIFIHY